MICKCSRWLLSPCGARCWLGLQIAACLPVNGPVPNFIRHRNGPKPIPLSRGRNLLRGGGKTPSRGFPMPDYPSLWRCHLHGDLWVELCCRGSEMQSSTDGAGSDMRGLHVEGKVSATPLLISLLFQMRWEVMGSLVPKSVAGWWEGSEWDLSLSLAPRPQFLSSVLWLKTRWEPQKTLFREGNRRWQKCVKQMCTRGFSPANARN